MQYFIIALILVIVLLVIVPYLAPKSNDYNSRSWEQPKDRIKEKFGDIDWGIAITDIPEWYSNQKKQQEVQKEIYQRALPKPDITPLPKIQHREEIPVRREQ